MIPSPPFLNDNEPDSLELVPKEPLRILPKNPTESINSHISAGMRRRTPSENKFSELQITCHKPGGATSSVYKINGISVRTQDSDTEKCNNNPRRDVRNKNQE